jgi:signal transduction histidine kinase
MPPWTDSSQVAEPIELLQSDIQRMLRELRRARRQLALKDDELQDSLHGLSHEIRSPLVAIRGFASLLEEEFDERLPQPWRDYLGRIIKNADHLERLVSDMLAFSGLRACEESFAAIDVRELVNEVLAPLRFESRAKSSTIVIDDNLPMVFVRADSLRQVFANLLSNALKYARPRAPLEIHVGYEGGELFHKFFVRDNGLGIPVKQRQQIFAPFIRLHDLPGAPGSGLGLAIVKRLIHLHGGEVWVDSQPRRGSTFYFTLPRHPNSPKALLRKQSHVVERRVA